MIKNYIRSIFLILFIFSCLIAFPANKPAKKESLKTKQKVALSAEDSRKFDYYFYEAINAKVTENYDAYFDYISYCHQIDSTNAALLYEFGNFYNSLDQKSKALDFYKKAVKYDEANFYYNASLATLYLELQQYTEAIDVYKFLVSKDPSKFDIYLYLSESYRLDGDLPGAIATLDDLEKVAGLNEQIILQKVSLYSALDDRKKAYAEIQKCIDKYPADVKYYVYLGDLYMQDDRLQDAYITFSKAKAIDPENAALISAMAHYYEKTNNEEGAKRELYAALFSQKLDIDLKLGILAQYVGALQQSDGETQRANAILDTLMMEYPQEPKLNLMYGNLLMIQQKPNEAEFQFQVYAESNPTNPVGWELLIKTIPQDSLNRYIEVCKTAISYIPDEPIFYLRLAAGIYQEKDYPAAIDVLQKGISVVSDEDGPGLISELYGLSGSAYFELEKTDSAFVAYRKALEYNPQNLGILNNYSYYLSLEKKELDKAEKMSSITIKAEPTNPTYLDTYGWIMFEQGDYVTARIYIENAVRYSQEKENEVSAEVLEHFGDVLFKLGDEEKAKEYWEKAKEKGDSRSKTLDEKVKTGKYISEL
ncbi:tetratricopeptide repeat protein [Viscerimonas tarda]